MKYIIRYLLCLILILTVFGCSKKQEESEDVGITEQTPTNVEGSGTYLEKIRVPAEFGVAEYTTEEIASFKDYSAEELKDAIHTIPDLVQYIIECEYAQPPGVIGDFWYRWDNYLVSLNRSPQGALRLQSDSCGSVSNLARYILADDYDYVGFILLASTINYEENCGGHVYNYFVKDGKILTFDFTSPIYYKETADAGAGKLINDFSEIRHGKHEGHNDYRVVVTRDWYEDHPAGIGVDLNEGGGRCWFFDVQYKDNMIVVWDDVEYAKTISDKIPDYVYHDLFEDVGYDPDTIPYEVMDYEPISEWKN